jgi:hypothetical protein
VLDVVDDRLSATPFVVPSADAARPIAGVIAMCVGGSLASGDYQPGISDSDLVECIEALLDEERQTRLIGLHQTTIRADARASKLRCIYVPVDQIADLGREHVTWAFGELFERTLPHPTYVASCRRCCLVPTICRALPAARPVSRGAMGPRSRRCYGGRGVGPSGRGRFGCGVGVPTIG